jgi:uncharacterized protein (DUF1499 family)
MKSLCTITRKVCVQLQEKFVYNYKKSLCTITRIVCVRLQEKFVYDYKKNLCTITRKVCVQLQERFVYNYNFYQILTASNMVKIMSEFVLLLPNTVRLQHGEDYVRVCTTSTKYWPPPTWWRLCQSLYYFYQILTASNKVRIMSEFVLLLPNTYRLQHGEDYVRVCTTSTKYLPPPTRWRLCQSLYYFYQILAASNMVKIMSEFVLLLPNTDRLQHGEDYVRVCTTSTKYLPPSTWWSVFGRSSTNSDIIFTMLEAVSIW